MSVWVCVYVCGGEVEEWMDVGGVGNGVWVSIFVCL